MELSDRLKHPRVETNEDGRSFMHPGYEIRVCNLCGSPFICAVNSISSCCGDYKKDKEAQYA